MSKYCRPKKRTTFRPRRRKVGSVAPPISYSNKNLATFMRAQTARERMERAIANGKRDPAGNRIKSFVKALVGR